MSTHEKNLRKGLTRALKAAGFEPEQMLWEYVALEANRQYISHRTLLLIRATAMQLEKRTRATPPAVFWWVNETAYTLARALAREAEEGDPGASDMALHDKLIERCNAAQQWSVDTHNGELAEKV